jgi:DNA repair photolyase
MAARFARVPEGGWACEQVRSAAVAGKVGRKSGTIMFPTTHDLTPENMGVTVPHLRRLLEAGNQVLVVSKPHIQVIDRITSELAAYRSKVLFRFTVGTSRDEVLGFLEPGAPTFSERMACIILAVSRGWRVSVSMEPLLEVNEDRVVAIVEVLQAAGVEEVWIGKLNRAQGTMKHNGRWDDAHRAMVASIQASQSDDRIRSLHARLGGNPVVRWKESIKAVVGMELKTDASEGEAWAAGQGDLFAVR